MKNGGFLPSKTPQIGVFGIEVDVVLENSKKFAKIG